MVWYGNSKEDVRIRVKTTSVFPDGRTIEVELGDPDGEQWTLHYFAVERDTLQARAEADSDLMKADRYEGTFKVEGSQLVRHGDTITLTDRDYADGEGSYVVEGVTTRFGEAGFSRAVRI